MMSVDPPAALTAPKMLVVVTLGVGFWPRSHRDDDLSKERWVWSSRLELGIKRKKKEKDARAWSKVAGSDVGRERKKAVSSSGTRCCIMDFCAGKTSGDHLVC